MIFNILSFSNPILNGSGNVKEVIRTIKAEIVESK